MNRILFACLFLLSNAVFSQSKAFECELMPLAKAIIKIEKEFDVKYSYADSLIADKRFLLLKKQYSIEGINLEIEIQAKLQAKKISDRYYALVSIDENNRLIPLNEVVIGSFLINGVSKYNQRFVLLPQKSEVLAGVTDSDVLLSLQQLPGVKSPNETVTGMYVRGGTQDQNLMLLDGIRLYHPGHLFGMISGINPNIVKSVSFYNKATPANYGERASSVIDIETSGKLEQQATINAGVNALNADCFMQVPIIKNKLDVQVSGRKSFTELWRSTTFNQLANKVFQNTDFKSFNDSNTFQFYDYLAKIIFKPSDKSTITITGLSINNDLNYKYKITADSTSSQQMSILDDGYSVNWHHQFSDRFSQKFSAYYSVYDFRYSKKKENDTTQDYEVFKKLNRIVNSGAEISFHSLINQKMQLDYGYQVSGNDVSHLFNTYNQDVGIDLNQRKLFNVLHAVYLSHDYALQRWRFQTGLRYNYFSKTEMHTFEPRLFIQNKITEALVLQFSYERKNQFMSQARENSINDLSLENYVWVLSDNEKYPIQKANQFSAGFIYKENNWLLDVDGYYKTINGITGLNFGFFNQNDQATSKGQGFTKGAEVFVQKKAKDWRTSVTYSFQDSQNKFEGLHAGRYFTANSNIAHAVNVNLNKKWKQFSAALGWFWHTGKPYSYINERGMIESFNENNLPVYHRMDVSCEYTFSSGKIKFRTGFSIYNLYNRKSIISREYERQFVSVGDLANERYKRNDYYSLGITPNVFFRIVI
ncbi:TonB-dependent receptor plug domain-containing protein [Flavobacterium pallidum]|uniref:TonB-dependent receptor plug domain-containing protein n=1 Tax=Flavobacterium pallidum TaxID=2172098 RepID=A0A2S1SH09_9FLAO|nr:TonB-dependent receptor plug domain-containing protein [Flavobacterium pallidum]AWI25698.1 hypothetical protein HYN49_07175 [Flavobacterium pallidum]